MNEPLLLLTAGLLFVIILLLVILLNRINRVIKNADANNYAEFIRLLQNTEGAVTNSLNEFRKESREISTEIRDDNQKSFANQQDALLNRMVETVCCKINI